MTGDRLKQIVATCGYTQKELTERMPSVKYEQDWTRIFALKDVKSGLLEELAKVLGKSVGQLYDDKYAPRSSPSSMPSTWTLCEHAIGRSIKCSSRLISSSHFWEIIR